MHLAAPGDQIWAVSAFPDDVSSYETFDGTSMSAPVVSGAAVLLWSAFPTATVAQVRCRPRLPGLSMPGEGKLSASMHCRPC